jgi:hypothetical protein
VFFSKETLSSGMKLAMIITVRNDKLIVMFVDVPKPLSIKKLGTTSFKATGVAHRITPHVNPRISLPTQIA